MKTSITIIYLSYIFNFSYAIVIVKNIEKLFIILYLKKN